MATSSHNLCLDNHSSVYSACEEICSEWEKLAAHLSVNRSHVKTIKTDGKDSVECLLRLLDAWLKRSSPEQPLPSWRSLCDALSHLDLSLSERVSTQHQCGCSQCTGILGAAPVGILSPLYNEIYQQLKTPLSVAEYMYSEKAFSLEQLVKVQESTCNKMEVLFTTLESAVSLNHYHLKVFATALANEEETRSIGTTLLSNYKGNFPTLTKSREFVVDVQYKKEFQKMRIALGKLCDTTVSLLEEKIVKVSELKRQLRFSFPELKADLQNCGSLLEVVDDIIRPRVSLIQIDYLEGIFELFDLATDSIDAYNLRVEEFCEKMRVEHAYGQLLMEEFDRHIPKVESITFVLDWPDKNEYYLKDVQDLFKKIVRKYYSRVKVVVMFLGNSVVIECCVPSHLHSFFVRMIQDSEEILNKEKVISVTAGGCTVFKRTVAVEQHIDLQGAIQAETTDEVVDVASVHSSDASVMPSSGIDVGDETLSVDDDVSYAEGVRIYEMHFRDLKTKETKLKQGLSMKESMIKKMSVELELMRGKVLYSKLPDTNVPELSEELVGAAESGNSLMVNSLLSIGMNANSKGRYGDTALMRASAGGHTEVVQLLLSARASVKEKDNYDSDTALMKASARGHTEVVQLLLSAEASVKEKNNYDGDTALMRASASGHTEVVQLLLSAGASMKEKDNFGNTALMQASSGGHTEVVQLLLSAEASVKEKNNVGNTALMQASAGGHTEVVPLLLSAGACVKEKNNCGDTALMQASDRGHTEVVQLLLSAGASTEEKNFSHPVMGEKN